MLILKESPQTNIYLAMLPPELVKLLSDCVRVIARTVKKAKEQGVVVSTEFHNRTRSIKKRIYSIAKVLKNRTNQARQEVKEITSNILSTAREVVGQAALRKREVEKISLPRRGWLTYERRDYQSQSWFKYLQRWRAGEEAQISYLKRKYGIGRSLSMNYYCSSGRIKGAVKKGMACP